MLWRHYEEFKACLYTYEIKMTGLQMNPYVDALSLYDIAGTPGVAADISHINTRSVAKV